jgi:hypothetical protein
MIGRAGRPGFDTHADAVVMTRGEMKEYYKRVRNYIVFITSLSYSGISTDISTFSAYYFLYYSFYIMLFLSSLALNKELMKT